MAGVMLLIFVELEHSEAVIKKAITEVEIAW